MTFVLIDKKKKTFVLVNLSLNFMCYREMKKRCKTILSSWGPKRQEEACFSVGVRSSSTGRSNRVVGMLLTESGNGRLHGKIR